MKNQNHQWQGFEDYHSNVLSSKLIELQKTIKLHKKQQVKKAIPYFFIALLCFILWALSSWIGVNIFDFMSGNRNNFYWIGIVCFFLIAFFIFINGDAEQTAEAEIINLVTAFRGWQHIHQPNEEILAPFLTFPNPINQLLKAKVGFNSNSAKSLKDVKHNLFNHINLTNSVWCEINSVAEYQLTESEDCDDEEDEYFEGVLVEINLTTPLEQKLIFYPKTVTNIFSTIKNKDISDYLVMPEVVLNSEFSDDYIGFSDTNIEKVTEIFRLIEELSSETVTIKYAFGYMADNKVLLALATDNMFFDTQILESNNGIDLLKGRLSYIETWVNELNVKRQKPI